MERLRSLTCKLCDWLSKWFSARSEPVCARLWDELYTWEEAYSNESALWSEEPDESRELIEQASAIQDSDPEAAFLLYLRAADAGSAGAMRMVAWHYDKGTCVAADIEQALEYYYRAICAGSWLATLSYAQLLERQGRLDDCERVLQDGVGSDFVPAYFWLARFRYRQSKSRKTCREIRPLLEYAAGKGHPGATRFLATLLMWGKYGLREIPRGFRMAGERIEEEEAEEEAVSKIASSAYSGSA